ncbi:MAG: TIGR02186 family protein [Hyphomonadaceae bacterium]|nr:TIGR02186 family protein [Hyphomonadaceae bacterium]MBP9233972.1 TIGR02186 family protein [Hyphomonadaceae bacterium]
MKIRFLILALAALVIPQASAQRVEGRDRPFMAAGLAEDVVELKVNYSGSRIVLFATAPQPENETSGMAVALIGPMAPQKMIHRTATGDETIEFVAAPLVFAIGAEPQVAASVALEVMIEAGLNAQASAMPRSNQLMSPDLDKWRTAFVDLKMEQGLYSFSDTTIERLDGGLRRAKIALPINAPPGEYRIRAVSFRNGAPVGESEQVLTIVRSGLDATLFDLSRQHGFIYGFVAVLLGVSVGGIAAWFGRK